MEMLETKEPLLISPWGEHSGTYVLPAGTTLYVYRGNDEGHITYVVYFNHKGQLNAEPVAMRPEWEGYRIAPLWLENINKVALENLFREFPLSKEAVTELIKSNGLTRDDLADIIRNLPE